LKYDFPLEHYGIKDKLFYAIHLILHLSGGGPPISQSFANVANGNPLTQKNFSLLAPEW